jgi:hypothetical protein
MEPAADGLVHMTRQDDIFEEMCIKVQKTFLCLNLTAMKRDLTTEEAYILSEWSHICAVITPPASPSVT